MTSPPRDDGIDPLVGSTRIAALLGSSRTQAWRLMNARAFGEVFDIAPSGALRAQLRVRQSGVDAWIASRQLEKAAS